MKLRFEPSGTHVHKGVLKVRFDFIPDLTDNSYPLHHVFVVDETTQKFKQGYKGKLDTEGEPIDYADYQKWLDGLPHIWRTNPCLSWFIPVTETFQLPSLESYLASLLNKDTVATLDNYLTLPNSAHYVSPFTRGKPKFTDKKIVTTDVQGLIVAVNQKFALWAEKPLEKGGTIQPVVKDSIAIGMGATDRNTTSSTGYTRVDGNAAGQANGDGTIDTWETWFATTGAGFEVATAPATGNVFTTRDNESIGAVTAGSKQTFAWLSTDVLTGDYPMLYWTGGTIERSSDAGSFYWYKSGDNIPCTGVTFINSGAATVTYSIYGTGGAGGETYQMSITDGLTVGESISTKATFGMAVTDGLKGGESVGSQATFGVSILDGFKGGDSPSGQATFQMSVADGLTVGDVALIGLIYQLSVSDGMQLGEGALGSAFLHEYYTTGDDIGEVIYTTNWLAQTFTPSAVHKITSVKLRLLRVGSPGTATVSIKAVDGSGHPTGGDLCSGTIDGDTLTTDSGGAWYEITLGAGYVLPASQHAIVVRIAGGDAGNQIRWRSDESTPTYSGGSKELSNDSGSSWTSFPYTDCMFEEWGQRSHPILTQLMSMILSDGVKLGEVLAPNVTFPMLVADGLKIGDSPLFNAILQVLVTDGVELGDTASLVLAAGVYAMLISDGFQMGDTISLAELRAYIEKTPRIGDKILRTGIWGVRARHGRL